MSSSSLLDQPLVRQPVESVAAITGSISTSVWDRRFFAMAQLVASYSKDPSTKVGCVLFNPETKAILPSGYNGLPRKMQDFKERLEIREAKYMLTVHAELNALLCCALSGVSTGGLGAAVTFYPCSNCAGALVQAGIREIVTVEPDWAHERWGASFRWTNLIFAECGVKVRFIEEETGK